MGEIGKGFIATIKMNFMQNKLCISNDTDLNFRQKLPNLQNSQQIYMDQEKNKI